MRLAAAKRALRHLGTTRQIRLHFPSSLNEATANTSIQVGLHGFTDSDWAGRRESIGGCTFIDGGPINWQAKPESVVALSTLEAEYIASPDATREAIWLRRLRNTMFRQ